MLGTYRKLNHHCRLASGLFDLIGSLFSVLDNKSQLKLCPSMTGYPFKGINFGGHLSVEDCFQKHEVLSIMGILSMVGAKTWKLTQFFTCHFQTMKEGNILHCIVNLMTWKPLHSFFHECQEDESHILHLHYFFLNRC